MKKLRKLDFLNNLKFYKIVILNGIYIYTRYKYFYQSFE